jgi:hypothetical protein
MTRKGKLTKILEHPHETAYKNLHCHFATGEETRPQRCHSAAGEESLFYQFLK